MDALVRDCHKLSKHQAASTQKALSAVDFAIEQLEQVRTQLPTESSAVAHKEALEKAQAQIDSTHTIVSEQLKELYGNVSKYGKHVEKAFKMDLSFVSESRAFEDKKEILAQSILLHFLREGDFETGSSFAKEAGLELPRETQAQFEAMYNTVSAIRAPQHDLTPALAWAVQNREQLEAHGIMLEFELHRLRFLQLVEQGAPIEALGYARKWFPRFGRRKQDVPQPEENDGDVAMGEDDMLEDGHTGHRTETAAARAAMAHAAHSQLEEIEHLMGIFIFARRLDDSPYAGQFTAQRWEDGAHLFASAFCTLLGLSSSSPLSVTIGAGARALPIVCKVSGLLRDKRVEWSQQNELAVEVPLPDDMRFHSVFACPVSKEQATLENPPMMMPCGHVVCKASLDKLAKGVRPGAIASGRFKCPYCPGMSCLTDAKRVHF
ncbi:hypothetical protein H4R20_004273 [Coemansia guatemalensis]|uniref:GID complex catalytic subunit 2 n=1 Tax=Coemansia guatemalensis TaxID=2761395 RepID=A0A9W8HSB8_9FUNG|nr:hypothetical protein H4R20_004273 [Coemansia guatemalensis]